MLDHIFQDQEQYRRWRLRKIQRIERRLPYAFAANGKQVLDVGCGTEAPLSFYLSTAKQATVFAGELAYDSVSSARQAAQQANMACFRAEQLPFADQQFESVYLLSMLEHVHDPRATLYEAYRVTRPGGMLFIEFSPYYAYPSGHHLYTLGFPKGFLPFQWMPRELTRQIVLHAQLNTKDTPEFLFEQFDTLNKIRVSTFRNIIHEMGLTVCDEYAMLVLPNGEIPLPEIHRLPYLRELVAMGYTCVALK